MELQIQDLISSIKKDGIEAAEAQANAIVEEANKKAAEIVAKAKEEAAAKVSEAEQKIATIKEGAQVNVAQAQRDAVLSFKSSIEEEFRKLLAADIKKTVKGKTLATLIKAALAEEDPANYCAEVAEVTDGLKGELAAEIENGLEVKLSSNIHGGFKLAAKDGSGFFDCTDEEIAEMLKPFFSALSI